MVTAIGTWTVLAAGAVDLPRSTRRAAHGSGEIWVTGGLARRDRERPFDSSRSSAGVVCITLSGICSVTPAFAHGVSSAEAAFMKASPGAHWDAYALFGAEHMITGYDHVLFLLGVLFLLRSWRDVVLFATLFSLGHSLTLLGGVLASIKVNPYLVDAIIGLSIVYKGIDNLDGFRRLLGRAPDPRAAVFLFGLAHGLGLATKLIDAKINPSGIVGNLIAFNIGVEFGQLIVLLVLLLVIALLRSAGLAERYGYRINLLLVTAGTTIAAANGIKAVMG